MANRNTQLVAEAALTSTVVKGVVTQEVVEAALYPTDVHMRMTQLVVEAALQANAVAGTGAPATGSAIFQTMIEQASNMHGGAKNLFIRLSSNASVPSDGLWKECRVYSPLMHVSYPNFISYGGFIKWTFGAALPSGVQMIQRVGVLFYDINYNFISEAYADWGYGNVQGTTGGLYQRLVPTAVAAVPNNAAYMRFQCGAFINNNSGSTFLTSGSLYGDMRFDDVWCIQQTDPTNAIQPKGSIPPNYIKSFTYTSTTTSITWAWAGLVIFRADGNSLAITDGSVTVSGLLPGTTYYFFPYWNEDIQAIAWVRSSHGTAPYNYAFKVTELDLTQTQQQNFLNRVALSTTAMPAATTSGGTGGGFGGGSGGCHRKGMKVLTKTRGVQPIETCTVGEWILGRHDWTQIAHHEVIPHATFVRVELESGDAIEVTPTHPFTLSGNDGDEEKRALDLSLSDMMFIRSGVSYIHSISIVEATEERAEKVVVTCEPEREFWAGENEPNILSHNLMMLS